MFVIYIGVLNFFPFLMNVANANVANAPLREAKVEPKACILKEGAWEGKI